MICLAGQGPKLVEMPVDELLSPKGVEHLPLFIEAADDITRQHGVPLERLNLRTTDYGKPIMEVMDASDPLDDWPGYEWLGVTHQVLGRQLTSSAFFVESYTDEMRPLINSIFHHEAGHLVGGDESLSKGLTLFSDYLKNLAIANVWKGLAFPRHQRFIIHQFGSAKNFYEASKMLDQELAPRFEFLAGLYDRTPESLARYMDYGSALLCDLRAYVVDLPDSLRNGLRALNLSPWHMRAYSAPEDWGDYELSSVFRFQRELVLCDADELFSQAKNRRARLRAFTENFLTSREMCADAYAARHCRDPRDYIRALREVEGWEDKKAEEECAFDPHPPVPERVARLQRIFLPMVQ